MVGVQYPERIVRHAAWLAFTAVVIAGGQDRCLADDAGWGPVEAPLRFLRLTPDDDGEPKALEVVIVRCAPVERDSAEPVVDLISAVHVAEPEYYSQLNREFPKYDAVLYELVAPEGAQVPKGGHRTTNPVSFIQRGLTDLLELQFQLEGIDYTGENLVHADMSPEQFAHSMRERGESFGDIFFRMMGYNMARQSEGAGTTSDAQLLRALFSGNRAMALRRVMAEQFETMQGAFRVIDGPDGSTLIAERNKVALDVLRKELDAGRRKVAIFYGAGHMDDIVVRLRENFGLAPVGVRWLTAWKLQ